MPTCQDILDELENKIPVSLAYDWDNCGLLVGNRQKEVKRVITCLDCDMNVVEEAKEKNADMILSHHPFFFYEKKRYTDDDYYMRVLKEMMKQDLCYYAAHTNMDIARGGMNDTLGAKIGLGNATAVLDPIDEKDGLGRIYKLTRPMTVADLCRKVKNGLGATHVSYTGDAKRAVQTIGLCSGSGQSLADLALQKGCDAYITGDFRHDGAKDYLRQDLSLILIRHYDSEVIIKEIYDKLLKDAFGDLIDVVATSVEKPIFQTFND